MCEVDSLNVLDALRAAPLLRVKAKITVKNTLCRSPRRQHTVFLTVILALTLKSGVALRAVEEEESAT